MAALIIDGLVLIIPVFAIAYLFSVAFPHHGFFVTRSGTTTTTTTAGGTSSTHFNAVLPLPGVLLISALSLSYFFLLEALRGQTVGKRVMGLQVQSAVDGPAGLGATAARTILRLIDGIAFYLVGWLVALLSGTRRRRLGDWAGGTVVVRDDGAAVGRAHHAPWQVALFPAGCLITVLAATFALGLGTGLTQGEQAVALVRSYVLAREEGNASLACSMLTSAQQREIVAIEGRSYARAQSSLCPAFILRSEPNSHLLNPELMRLAELPLTGVPTPYGGDVVYAPQDPNLHLVVVPENGQLKLDMRGIEKLEFVRACAAEDRLTSEECSCTFDLARSQEALPERQLTPSVLSRIAADGVRCQGGASVIES